MGYICHECHSKIADAREKARKEINRRLDAGERLEDICVEYENEHYKLLDARECNTERFVFLEEAAAWCRFCFSCGEIERAGWRRNHSGEWVRKQEPKQAEKQRQISFKEFWQRLRNKE